MGCKEDMISLKNEVRNLGIVGRITNGRKDTTKSILNNKEVIQTTWRISISGSLARLLIALGATPGNKTKQESYLPQFVKNGSKTIKQSFLSAIFGGDGSALWYSKCPSGYKVEAPSFCLTKESYLTENLEQYLNDIKSLLLEFGIESYEISNPCKKTDKTVRKFVIAQQYENIIKFVDLIGYKWCKQKQNKMLITGEYIRYCIKCINEVESLRVQAKELKITMSYSEVAKLLNIPQHKVISLCKYTKSNLPQNCIKWNEFLEKTNADVITGTLCDSIEKIEQLPNLRVQL